MLHPDAQKMMANRAAPPDRIISIESSHASMLLIQKRWLASSSKRLTGPPEGPLCLGWASFRRAPEPLIRPLAVGVGALR
jgi:hypothetical protein